VVVGWWVDVVFEVHMKWKIKIKIKVKKSILEEVEKRTKPTTLPPYQISSF